MGSGGRVSAEDGSWETKGVFYARKLNETGSATYFTEDQAKTDTVTLSLTGTGSCVYPTKFRQGIIRRIHYRINPTNSETYTLRIWGKGGVTGNYESNLCMLYESPAAQADDTEYDKTELAIPFRLNVQSKIWYSLDWTGNPGTTTGFISVGGEYF